MSDRPIEPFAVAQKVEQYASEQYRFAVKASNRELLDDSGIYDLHTLAATIYELGFNEGEAAEGQRNNGQRQRLRDAIPRHQEVTP